MTAIWEEKLDGLDTSEAHWSIGTILTIFFAASLITAVFFGLGYSFGRGGITRATTGTALSAMPAPPRPTEKHQSQVSSSNPAKPMLSSPSLARPTYPMGNSDGQYGSNPIQQPLHEIVKQVAVAQNIQKPAASTTVSKVNAPIARTNAAVSGSTGASRYMVQVGAIGNRKDAQMLVAQLRKRGFHAGIYPGKRDRFLHVQIGPFANTEQAQSMRHKVMANGYHALLKPVS